MIAVVEITLKAYPYGIECWRATNTKINKDFATIAGPTASKDVIGNAVEHEQRPYSFTRTVCIPLLATNNHSSHSALFSPAFKGPPDEQKLATKQTHIRSNVYAASRPRVVLSRTTTTKTEHEHQQFS